MMACSFLGRRGLILALSLAVPGVQGLKAQTAQPPPPGGLDAWFSNEPGAAPVFTRSDVQALFSSAPPQVESAPAPNPDRTQAAAGQSGFGVAGAIKDLVAPPAEAAATALAAQPAPEAAPPSAPVATGTISSRPPTGRRIGAGRAVWYEHPGRTASGEPYNPNQLTAAHKTLPFGTRVRVVNLRNRRSVVVRINDRLSPKLGYAIDLSRRSARAIGIDGVGRVALFKID
jgi:rare lipoprotein A